VTHLPDAKPTRTAGSASDRGTEAENSYSAGLIGFITAFVPGHGGVTPNEATAWADDLSSLGRNYFFSLNRYLFIASK
jgi:hypothetical protein